MATAKKLEILAQEYGENLPIRTLYKNNPNKKAGKTYVIKCDYVYSSILKENVVISTECVGHRDPVTDEIVPNRAKRKNGEGPAPRQKTLKVTRTRVGAMEIMEKVGEYSKIDEKVYDSCDIGTAAKIVSTARYMAITEDPIKRIDDFALSHKLPYSFGMSADICYELFDYIGNNSKLEQNLFRNLSTIAEDSPIFAFDTTVVSTYSKDNDFSSPGYSKKKENLESFKVISLYSIEHRIPVMIDILKSEVPDVKVLFNTISKAKHYGLKKPTFILDRGFVKQENIYNLYKNEIEFVGATTITDSWVAKPLQEPYGGCPSLAQALDKIYLAKVFDGISAITIEQTIDFKRVYKKLGDEPKQFKVYLTYCKDDTKAKEDRAELAEELDNIKNLLEVEKKPYEELDEEEQELACRYLHLTYDEKDNLIGVEYNVDAIDKALQRAGIFCIASSFKKAPQEIVQLYRSRNRIEESYRISKSCMNGDRVRFNKKKKIRGAEICRMIAIGYYTNLQIAINNVIKQCEEKVSDKNLSETAKDKYRKLKNWLKGKALRSILQWFDGIEHLDIKSEYGQVRLTTEYVSRDQLFLDMLFAELKEPHKSKEISLTNLP